MQELVPYNRSLLINNSNNLSDNLGDTFKDIGQLIGYTRDLTRSLVPLSDKLHEVLSNPSDVISDFIDANPGLVVLCIGGVALVSGYFVSGIVKNVLDIKRSVGGK